HWDPAATTAKPKERGTGGGPAAPRLEGSPLPRRPTRLDLFDTRRAVFELRNLSDRVELRIGQDVGGRLGIAERDEDHAGRDRAVSARLELDGTAARRDAHHGPGRDAEAAEIGRRQRGDRLRLDLVEHAGAPGHRPGVPML